MLPDKVIFLDIDGPMIPSTMFLINRMSSAERHCSPLAIAVLNNVCKITRAKIVFNSTHNSSWDGAEDIEKALVTQGLDPSHLHPTDLKTRYPQLRRNEAVEEWLRLHPEVTNWVAFDDTDFTKDKKLILIDPDAGLHLGHLNQAVEILGGNKFIVLV